LEDKKITSKKSNEIEDIAKDYDFEVMVWDGQKLESLIFKYPLIYQWYFGEELPLFLKYQDFFSDELTGEGIPDHRITLYGREAQIEDFKESSRSIQSEY